MAKKKDKARPRKITRKTKVRLATLGAAHTADLMLLSKDGLKARIRKLFAALREGFDMELSKEITRCRTALKARG